MKERFGQLRAAFGNLSQRERVLVGAAGSVVLLFAGWLVSLLTTSLKSRSSTSNTSSAPSSVRRSIFSGDEVTAKTVAPMARAI